VTAFVSFIPEIVNAGRKCCYDD